MAAKRKRPMIKNVNINVNTGGGGKSARNVVKAVRKAVKKSTGKAVKSRRK